MVSTYPYWCNLSQNRLMMVKRSAFNRELIDPQDTNSTVVCSNPLIAQDTLLDSRRYSQASLVSFTQP